MLLTCRRGIQNSGDSEEREGGNKPNHRDASLKGIGKQGLNLEYVQRHGSCPKPTLRGQAGGEDYAGCGDQSTQKQIYTHIYGLSVDGPAKMKSHAERKV